VPMRTPARRFEREEMVAYIHGIEPNGDIAHILVHKKGTSVRFSGRLGEHKVALPNAEDLEHWVNEAESVWGLEAAIGVPISGSWGSSITPWRPPVSM